MKKLFFSRVLAGGGLLAALTAGLVPVARGQADPIFDPILGPPVRIVSPANHEVFYAPVDIPVLAYTRSEAVFTNVEFYANGIDLGPGVKLSTAIGPVFPTLASPSVMGPDVLGRLGALWGLVWSNPLPGSFALTAVASGHEVVEPLEPLLGLSRTSAPVNITILPPVNGTNLPDVVNIVATDPIAIAGTNSSWVWPGETAVVPSWTNWPPLQWACFTNWGPKAALFTVRRFGDASSPLTVYYSIGGTASNGVDYVALPGDVTIPASGVVGLIPIVPIDHGASQPVKTVILTLTGPPGLSPLDYIIGVPFRAEALIFYRWPRLPLPLPLAVLPAADSVLPDGAFHFNASGPDGAWVAIQNSTDLANWSSVGTNQVIQGSLDFIDPNAPANAAGFYRFVPLNNASSP